MTKIEVGPAAKRCLVLVAMIACGPPSFAQGATPAYRVGDIVEVQRAEGWLKGKVTEAKESYGTVWYSISYGWQGSTYNMFAQAKDLRPGAAQTAVLEMKVEGNTGPATQAPRATNDRAAALKYKPGDRVACDVLEVGAFENGTVVDFPPADRFNGFLPDSGYFFRVKLDRRAAGGTVQTVPCKATHIRASAEVPADNKIAEKLAIGPVVVDGHNTLSADRPILACPVKQAPVKNGAQPSPQLLTQVLRCRLGESAAAKGQDGALTVDVSALQVGSPRKWLLNNDMGGGTPGVTLVYPVKATYTEKTFYRSRTVVNDNWIRIFNFFVNGLGEWQYGSAETIKRPELKDVPRGP